MPYPAPHNFPTLRGIVNEPYRRSLLLIGAGMSIKSVPMPGELLSAKGAAASAKIGCAPPDAGDTLYTWAERAHAQLAATGDSNPKLTLARLLGLVDEALWLGCSSSQRNAPRHRVIARFGREGMWEQLWSLNWDCLLESAFENVGISRNGYDARMPWPSGYRTFVTAQDCGQMAGDNQVHFVKPHGCVRALVDADTKLKAGDVGGSVTIANRFMLTHAELNAIAPGVDPAQTYVFSALCNRMVASPFIAAGWSAGEPYLVEFIEQQVQPQLAARTLAVDELCILDMVFRPGHVRVAAAYNKTEAQAHVPVVVTGLSTDDLFLWIQALYGLQRLKLVVYGRAADVAAITALEAEIPPPDCRYRRPCFILGRDEETLRIRHLGSRASAARRSRGDDRRVVAVAPCSQGARGRTATAGV